MSARMYDTPFGDAFFTSCVCLLISFAATPQRLPYRAVGESLPLLQRQLLRPAKWQTVVPACRAAFSSFLNPSCSHFMRRVDVLEQSSGPAGDLGLSSSSQYGTVVSSVQGRNPSAHLAWMAL